MSTIGPMIAASAKLGLGYATRLMADIDASQFSSFARVGDQIVPSNHPAFVCGHLSIYPARIVKELGGDASAIEPSAEWLELFSPSATCVDDPNGTSHPGKAELVSVMTQNYEAAIAALEAASDDAFAPPNANEKMRSKFPTIGAMHAFYVGGHFMVHMGQVSAWRRMIGLPPA